MIQPKTIAKRLTALLAILLFTLVQPLHAQGEKQLVIGQQPVYKVARATAPITVDGRGGRGGLEEGTGGIV